MPTKDYGERATRTEAVPSLSRTDGLFIPSTRRAPGASSDGDNHLGQIEHDSRLDDIRRGSRRACRLIALVSPVNEDRAADEDDPTLRLILPDQPSRL